MLVFRDISERRKTERALAKSLGYADDIIATLREPFVVLDGDLRVRTANRSFYDTFHVSKDETENRLVYELENGKWDIPALRGLLDDVLSRTSLFTTLKLNIRFPVLGERQCCSMLVHFHPTRNIPN